MAKKKKTVKGEIVDKVLTDFPNSPSLTLAKKIYKENPKVFTSIDDARSTIRYYRDAMGKKTSKYLSTRKHVRDFDPKSWNPFGLPPSDEAEYLPYHLRKEANNILCLYDVHVPYHNVDALTNAIQYGKKNDVNTIFIGGDFLDFYGLSTFEKDPRKRRFSQELEDGREILGILRREFPKAYIYYMLGNHEERYERYLRVKAPELLDCSDFKVDVLLRFGQMGIELIDGKRIAKAGKLNLIHGHEFGRQFFSPVNPARGLYMKSKESAICGHHHQTSEHSERSLSGDVDTCWSVGCLCELNPDYRPINKWNHGFAHVKVNEDGNYKVFNYKIIEGEVY